MEPYDSGFTIAVVINTEGADLAGGVSVNVNYSGTASYTGYTAGNADCFNLTVDENTPGTIAVTCMKEPYNGNYTVAQLNFQPTSAGSLSLTITDVEGNLDSTTGGSYTISGGSNITLPKTAGSDKTVALIIIGFSLILSSLAIICSNYLLVRMKQGNIIVGQSTNKNKGSCQENKQSRFEKKMLDLARKRHSQK